MSTKKITEITEAKIDDAEFAVAQAEASVSDSVATVEFSTPFTYEGKTYEKLVFDFDRLTGNDGIAIESELQALGKPVIVPALSGDYLIRMAAKACTDVLGADAILAMRLSDFNRLRNGARPFFAKLGV